jgi:hypothetical protein
MSNPFGRMGVPLVGAEMEAFECVVLVSLRCKCRAENRPMLLKGHEQGVACAHCGRVFAIAGVRFDRRTGRPPEATVACIGRHEADEDEAPAVTFSEQPQ